MIGVPGEAPPEGEPDPVASTIAGEGAAPDASTTVGTGSVLAIGCLAIVLLLVIAAFAVRWFGGSW